MNPDIKRIRIANEKFLEHCGLGMLLRIKGTYYGHFSYLGVIYDGFKIK